MAPDANQQIDRAPDETNSAAPAVPVPEPETPPTASAVDAAVLQRSEAQYRALHQKPTLGRIVLATLTADDAEKINRRRTTGDEISRQMTVGLWPKGAQAHIGNDVKEGDTFCALVVRVWNDATVNLKIQLDGTDQYWATQRELGTGPGTWAWPAR